MLEYRCEEHSIEGFPALNSEVWSDLPKMVLVDTASGDQPRLSTSVAIFWNRQRESIGFRFTCEDDHIVSTMTKHDDPIYREDVVEVFICETGNLNQYREFEVSPRNVKFDAIIHNSPPEPIRVITEWHAAGWETAVYYEEGQSGYVSIWEIPFSNFSGGCPSVGKHWRINCYRIDRGLHQPDQYSAWSPTGALQFHIPASFGILRFE